ncbi:hypothetical protein [Streptomyces shenzhenensis]|uniref:hypothetical protein n=1 Tax=Streptomyces shenzhenensis TaxID=943815 RepID=UPI0011C47C2E|nr:hypothetical protein [Streptomyces shenzhenensis]
MNALHRTSEPLEPAEPVVPDDRADTASAEFVTSVGRGPLATIEAFEAGAFRTGYVARRLLAELPGLPLREISPLATAYADRDATTAQLELNTGAVEGVRAWGDVLGAEVEVSFHDERRSRRVYELHEVKGMIGGVAVRVVDIRSLPADEAAAWRRARHRADGGDDS